jgi:hypothetical protein
VSYLEVGVALAIAGTGTSFCFPTVANAVMGSVPLKEAGIASGANSALRELGGVMGVAVLAGVFARHGVYTSNRIFIDGFTQALWVAVGFSALGFVAALFTAGRTGQGLVQELVPAAALESEAA